MLIRLKTDLILVFDTSADLIALSVTNYTAHAHWHRRKLNLCRNKHCTTIKVCHEIFNACVNT